jgi:hypothetical protein
MKVLFFFAMLNVLVDVSGQNIGIGTTAPAARLHVADSSVLFDASGPVPATPGVPPVQGGGRRMMWYADKAAFRAGYINGNQWNESNIGNYSIATGRITIASGVASTAIGNETLASGIAATAMGRSTTASGDYSTAMGLHNFIQCYAGTAIGMFNDPIISTPTFPSSTAPLFIIGNGDDDANRSNAMVVRKNGNVGIGTNSPSARLDVDANFKLGANGTILNDIIKSTETYDIPSLGPGAVDIQTFTVANVNLGSAVSISPLFALPDGITISYARVSAAGTVEVKVVNAGAATQNPASMSSILVVIR